MERALLYIVVMIIYLIYRICKAIAENAEDKISKRCLEDEMQLLLLEEGIEIIIKKDIPPNYTGFYREDYANNELKYEVMCNDGKLEGPFSTFYSMVKPRAVMIQGSFKENEIDGELCIFYKNGKLKKKDSYKKGKKEGICRSYHLNGKLEREENYIDGIISGEYKIYNENEVMVEKGQIKNEVQDGIIEKFYHSGTPYILYYINDNKINGKFQAFYRNGNLMGECGVLNDLLNGTFKKYDRLGKVQEEVIFENGVPIPEIKIETTFPAECDYVIDALKNEIQKEKDDDKEEYENSFFRN